MVDPKLYRMGHNGTLRRTLLKLLSRPDSESGRKTAADVADKGVFSNTPTTHLSVIVGAASRRVGEMAVERTNGR
jgi:hypothetical protein